MQKVRVGIVGLGFMGRMHASCYNALQNVQIVAACARNWSQIENAAGGNLSGAESLELGNARRYDDAAQLFSDPEIDIVDLCVPTPQHRDLTIAALEAGKHVLCEKPMALTPADCDAMIEAAHRAKKQLFIGHCLRFWPQYTHAHRLLQSGELGEIYAARFERQSPFPRWNMWLQEAAQSGGAILDLHIHDIDCALWWFGAPQEIFARGVTRNGLTLSVDSSWKTQNGAHLQLHGRWDENDSPFKMSFELVGTNGTLRYDSSVGQSLQLFRADGKTEIAVEAQSGYFYQLEHVTHCVRNGAVSPLISGETGRESVRWACETALALRN